MTSSSRNESSSEKISKQTYTKKLLQQRKKDMFMHTYSCTPYTPCDIAFTYIRAFVHLTQHSSNMYITVHSDYTYVYTCVIEMKTILSLEIH